MFVFCTSINLYLSLLLLLLLVLARGGGEAVLVVLPPPAVDASPAVALVYACITSAWRQAEATLHPRESNGHSFGRHWAGSMSSSLHSSVHVHFRVRVHDHVRKGEE